MTRIVITGTGRSGTRFAAHLLRAAGVNCGHERVFSFRPLLRERPVAWGNWQADSSWMAVPHLAAHDGPAVLVVRHPLLVAKSMLELGWFRHDKRLDIAKLIYRFRPQIRAEKTRPDKVMAMWVHWNTAALPYVAGVFRLEDLNEHGAADLLDAVGVRRRPDPADLQAIRSDPQRANLKVDVPRESWSVDWADFRPELRSAGRRVARMFGYGPEFWH